MRMRLHVVALLIVTTVIPAAAVGDGWRIAVGGGRITGFIGILAGSGLSREILSDAELADIEVLRRYRVVIATTSVANTGAVARAIEQYVSEGGCAITEGAIAPSAQALPGRRIGPKRSPNIDFTGHNNPISATMRGTGTIVTTYGNAMAIIPSGGNATVLAHYTDDGVPDKYRGQLTGGRRDMPALVLFKHGRGQWLYSGAPIAFALALRSLDLQPAVLAAISQFTGGTLAPRFTTLDPDRRLLARVRWDAQVKEPPARRPPRGAEQQPLPDGFEALELPAEAPEDFLVLGDLTAGAEAEMLLPWFSADSHRRLRISGGRVRLIEVSAGRERLLAEGALPSVEGSAELAVRRRPRSVTVFVGRTAVLTAAMNPMAGTFAARGLGDVYLQECAPVVFADDFMRAEGEANPWETPAGSWKLYKVEGEPEQGSNPFAFRAEDGERSTAIAGYEFWDDYDFSAAVRPTARAVEILGHWRADDDYVALRLTLPEGESEGTLELVRRLPEGERVLKSAPVHAQPDRWHQLRLSLSRGRAVGALDGRQVIVAGDELLRGRGQVGLQVHGGGAYFDDVRVTAWEATPLPLGGEGAWRVERGTIAPEGDVLTLEPAGTARMLAPDAAYTDLHASAELQLRSADEAGLLLRYRSPGDHYLLALTRTGRSTSLRLIRRTRNEETVLAETPVSGGGWHHLEATLVGRNIAVKLDGRPAFTVADEALDAGEFGLTCAGGTASVQDAVAWPVDHERFRVDPPTPPYAGIIDLHTWAGAGSGWNPSPADPDVFWHRGLYVDDAEVRLGVHRAGKVAAASVMIGDGDDPEAGWVATAAQPAVGEPVLVTLLRAGQPVAAGEVDCWSGEGYVLSLQRVGGLVVARVDGETVCEYRDVKPLEGLRRVGFRRDGAIIDPADIEIFSSAARTWTFETAPVDWQVLSGTWEISSRWSCSPDWTWLAGWNQDGEARTMTRRSFIGDQRIDIYVGTKMMPKPEGNGYYEELRDLHFGLCEDGAGGGYHIVLGGEDNTRSKLLRNGETVVTSSYQIPQAERHNNWLLVTLDKRGATITVSVWGEEVFNFTDEEPIAGGRISVGTEHNGITVPRVTVYGVVAD